MTGEYEWAEVEHTWATDAGFTGVVMRYGSPYMGLHRCGYIALPEDHPWHGVEYGDIEPRPGVHGGLTFSAETSFQGGIQQWWIGFDCAHYGDGREPWPGVESLGKQRFDQLLSSGPVRNVYYVMQECESLALQAWEAARRDDTPRTGTHDH